MKQRGITEDFLHPDYAKLEDPLTLPDMAQAVNRIKKAVENHDHILI